MVATMLLMRVRASDTQEMITRIKIDLEKNTALEDIVSEIKNARRQGVSGEFHVFLKFGGNLMFKVRKYGKYIEN